MPPNVPGSPTSPGLSSRDAPTIAELQARIDKLERLRRRDEMALQVSRMGTWTRDMRTGLVEWSRELMRIFGLEEESYPRSHEEFLLWVHADDQSALVNAIANAIVNHDDFDVDFRYRHASGEYGWMTGRGRGFYDQEGALVELAGIGIEITAQRRSEEALLNRELQLRQIGDNLPDGALYQVEGDAAGERHFVYWSAGIERLSGVPAEEALANPISLYSLIHPEDAPRIAQAEEHSFRTQKIFDVVMRMKHRDTGEWRWVRLCSAPRHLSTGKIVWDGIYLDITRAKQVEEALKQSMERLHLAQRAGRIGVFDWNVKTNAIVWSDEEERIFGLAPGTFEGSLEGWARYVLPADLPQIQEHLRLAMDCGDEEVAFHFRIMRPDGALRWIEGSGKCFYNPDGEPVRMVGVNLDVTERREAEKALYEADRRKNEFLAMLGHELRNPLSAIRNALLVCEVADAEPDSLHWARGVIDRQSQQLSRLVDDLLDVSRITRGKVELRTEVLDAALVLDRAVESVRPILSERGHQLTASYAPGAQLTVLADPARLEQVVVNLLSNAAKYTEDRGLISLEAHHAGQEVVISVRDNGIGLDPDRIPQMFELFAQGERSLARTEGGLGLGLTIVRSLVELHGGRIEARSDGIGRGSEFLVRLPAWSETTVPAEKARPALIRAASARSILVVDDNVDTADGMARLLKRKGHRVEVAYDGPAALELASAQRPEFVLLDLGLPGMDGFEVARALRKQKQTKQAVIIAISGYGQEEDRKRSREAGFDHHLVKPANLDELVELLARSRN